MYHDKRIVAIIPARGGSKRLPRKNVLPFAGKPLIAWSIEAAQGSAYVDHIVVSSDDAEILSVAEGLGVEGQSRPAHLASDTASSAACVHYVLEQLQQQYDYVVLLQPTSPLRLSDDIDNAISLLVENRQQAVVSVTTAEHSPLWCNTLPESHSMANFIRPEVKGKRSQDLPVYYRLNGAVYAVKCDAFFQNQSFMPEEAMAYIMPNERSVDIDSLADFVCAEALHQHISESNITE